jgi:hypothetical protein
MATIIINQFSRKEIRNYVVVDKQSFSEEAESRLLAMGAAALLYWIDLAKGKFSANTSARYIESLYLDTGNPRRMVLGVLPDTLASLLEGGQAEHNLNPFFLEKFKITKGRFNKDGSLASNGRGGLREPGKKYRVIPVGKTGTYESTRTPPNLNQDGIGKILEQHTPRTARFMIASRVNKFNRTNAATHTYTPSGFFTQSADPQFRTITPDKIWKHPGIRAALLANQVGVWAQSQRDRFAAPLLGGDTGIVMPGGSVF